jgi:hypothetical protein
MPRNALSATVSPFEAPSGNALAPSPTAADAWDWHYQNAMDTLAALQNPQTWTDAARQYGNALLMGTTAPEGGNVINLSSLLRPSVVGQRLTEIAAQRAAPAWHFGDSAPMGLDAARKFVRDNVPWSGYLDAAPFLQSLAAGKSFDDLRAMARPEGRFPDSKIIDFLENYQVRPATP